MRIFTLLLEYIYKILIVAVYSMLIVTGVYYLCSRFAPLPVIDQYMDLEWILRRAIFQHGMIGPIAEYIQNFFDVSLNIHTSSTIDVVKEVINGITVIVFIKLGTGVYGLFSGFAHRLFSGKDLFSRLIDGLCTLMIIMTSIMFSQIVLDTIFHAASPVQYIWYVIGISLLFLALCTASILLKPGKSFMSFALDIVLGAFSLILVYTTVLVFEELTCYSHGYNTHLFLVLVLIVCIGFCTAMGTYYASRFNPWK